MFGFDLAKLSQLANPETLGKAMEFMNAWLAFMHKTGKKMDDLIAGVERLDNKAQYHADSLDEIKEQLAILISETNLTPNCKSVSRRWRTMIRDNAIWYQDLPSILGASCGAIAMATDPTNNPNDDFDDDTLAAFGKLLDKLGPSWLDKLRPPSSPALPPDPKGDNPITSFLQTALSKSEAAREKLAEQMDEMRAMLTPEQLTLLRSLKKPQNVPGDDPRQIRRLRRPRSRSESFCRTARICRNDSYRYSAFVVLYSCATCYGHAMPRNGVVRSRGGDAGEASRQCR